jgi:two-component system chemotaxis sensor kinase CheA
MLHTLKGNASTFGLSRLAGLCHELEDQIFGSEDDLSAAAREELATAWGRLARRVKALLGEGDELALDVQAQDCDELLRAVLEGESRPVLARRVTELKLERVEGRLRRFGSQARDLAARLGKARLDVEVEAAGIRLSREALAPFWTAFVHVVRNTVDHGVDSRQERARQRKPETARLSLRATRAGDEIAIEAGDDGPGVDWRAVAERAKALGLPHEDRPSLVDALFRDGFSTKSDVSDLSGRGMGLGAARDECERLGGSVTVLSEPGLGATFRFTFPIASVGGRETTDPGLPHEEAASTTGDAA